MKNSRSLIFIALLGLILAWPWTAPAQDGAGGSDGAPPVESLPPLDPIDLPSDSTATAVDPLPVAEAPADSIPVGEAAADSVQADADADESEPGGEDGDALLIPPGSLGVHPKFSTSSSAAENSFSRGGEMTLSITYPNLWTLGGKIDYTHTEPREFGRENIDTGYSLNTGMKLWNRIPIQLSVADHYVESTNISASYKRRDISETTGANMNAGGNLELRSWLLMNASTEVGVSKKDYQSYNGTKRRDFGRMSILTGHLDWLPAGGMKITTGYVGKLNSGEGELRGEMATIQSRNDSLRLETNVKVGKSLDLKFTGGLLQDTNEMLDFYRDANGLISDSTRIVTQESARDNWGGDLRMGWTPSPRFSLSCNLGYNSSIYRVSLREDLDKDLESHSLGWDIKLSPWTGGKLSAKYAENVNNSIDRSADSEKNSKKLNLDATQKLSDTFKLSFTGSFMLNRDIYANKTKNPQDRDKLQTQLTVKVEGRATPWLTASNSLQWFEDRNIYIMASRSNSNKDKRTLAWKGDLEYNFRGRYYVKQRCEVNVSEEDFVFSVDRNALDREFVLQTVSTVPIHGKVSVSFDHEFRLRENGGYQPDSTVAGFPKTFFRESRLKTERLKLGASYQFLPYLRVSCNEEVGREVDYVYVDKEQDIRIYGLLEFEVVFNKELGKNGQATARLKQRTRYGTSVRENQRSLWYPSLNLSYTF